MTSREQGGELSLEEAEAAFQGLPDRWQLASLHPRQAVVDAKRDASLQPVHWHFRRDGHRYLHSFHLRSNARLALQDVLAPYGYGGPLADTDDADFLNDADTAFCAWARSRSVVAEFLRFHPLVPHADWYRGNVAFNRHTVCIDLTQDVLAQCEARRRTDIRRFDESGLAVMQVPAATMIRVFPALYRQNMDRVAAGAEYYFSEAYFEALLGAPYVENWLVCLRDEPIAGAVILVSPRAATVEYHLSAVGDAFERHRPMIGLLHRVALHYQRASLRLFYLGGGRGTKEDDSLLYFKKGFSAVMMPFLLGSRIHDHRRYTELKAMFPAKAESGRILFYEDD